MNKIIIFDNHKIPRKYRCIDLYFDSFDYLSRDGFNYASDNKKSKSGRLKLEINIINPRLRFGNIYCFAFDIYLKPTEFTWL